MIGVSVSVFINPGVRGGEAVCNLHLNGLLHGTQKVNVVRGIFTFTYVAFV